MSLIGGTGLAGGGSGGGGGGGGGSVTVVNNPVSTSTTSALAAAQGKALKDTADALATTVADKAATSHTHTSADITDFAEASQDVVGAMVAAAGGSYNDAAGTITLPAGGGVTVVDSLTSTSTTNALSAAQGKNLKDTADALATTVAGKASSANPTLTGTVTLADGLLVTAAAMGANAIDVTQLRNTKTLAADTTFTFSGTPSDGAQWGLELTGDTSNRTVTLPASCVRADTGDAITSFVMPASRKSFVSFQRVGSVNYVDGIPGVAIMIPFAIETPADGDYTIALKSIWSGTVTAVTTKCASGTCTLTGKVNTTALGGTANSVSSTEQTRAHTSSNAVAVGDDLVVTISSNSSCSRLVGNIEMTVF